MSPEKPSTRISVKLDTRRSNSAERNEVSEETVTSAVNRSSQSLRESKDASGMDRDNSRYVQHPNAVDGWF